MGKHAKAFHGEAALRKLLAHLDANSASRAGNTHPWVAQVACRAHTAAPDGECIAGANHEGSVDIA